MNVSLHTSNTKVQRIVMQRAQDILPNVDAHITAPKAHAVLFAAGHTPRRLRSRIPVSCVRKLGRKGIALQRQNTPPSPNQECVINVVTGRSALGPWAGPFEALDKSVSPPSEPALPDLLYMDPQGYCHFGLNDKGQEAGLKEAAAKLMGQAGMQPAHVRRARLAEIAATQSRASEVQRPHTSRRGAASIRSSAATINQPRKNY